MVATTTKTVCFTICQDSKSLTYNFQPKTGIIDKDRYK